MNTRQLIKQELEWAATVLPYQPEKWSNGEPGGPRKLEPSEIPLIWELMVDLSDNQIAKKFCVTKAAINNIYRKRAWLSYEPSADLFEAVTNARNLRYTRNKFGSKPNDNQPI